jgi:NAD(P)-dependent dehydrogenase (short-subunit alcohol dehydrogenase family)
MSYQKPTIAPVHFPVFKTGLPSMKGKTVAITGTTTGTGRVAARTVTELGAKVLLLNRPSSRSDAGFSALREAFPKAELHQISCDLQSFESVRAAAKTVHALCPEGVHVLCNNAGVMALGDEATCDGYDVQMQTNHLSHFLLTGELLPLLERAAGESGEARVVNHSSIARMAPSKTLMERYLERRGGDLGGDGSGVQNALMRGPRWLRYNQSKLANCAFTAALHTRLQARGSGVKALVAHPGLANTNLQVTSVERGGMGKAITNLFMRMSQSPEDGTMGILSAMCLPDAQSGQFYGPGAGAMAGKGRAVAFALESYYDNAQTRDLIWRKSNEAVGGSYLS